MEGSEGGWPLTHALVMVEDGAVAFCHYENPRLHSPGRPRWMSEETLRGIVRWAEGHAIALTFLLGNSRPPAKVERSMDRVDHVKIVPLQLADVYSDAIPVIDSEDGAAFDRMPRDSSRNVIFRLARRDIAKCSGLCALLIDKCGRLSIHLRGVEYFTESDLVAYADELDALAVTLEKLYGNGHRIEVNVLTDRMMLSEMRNCDAGVNHVTVAPDGDCYICPAFLEDGDSIGYFDAASEFVAKRIASLELSRGPLCTRCDAFHCKRCVYLNRKLTEEFNVPSEQQCAIAHIEREASRLLLNRLSRVEPFRRMPRIAELNYRDPLEMIAAPQSYFPTRW